MQHKQPNRIFTYVAGVATVAIAAALIAVGAPAASAADGTVNVPAGKNTYVPATTSLNSGDTITWRNTGVHDIKSARIPAGAKAWSSPIQTTPGQTFSQTPTVAGNYRYFCSLHSTVAAANAASQDTTQMVGQFTVAAGGAAPAPAPGPVNGGGGAPQVDPAPGGGAQTGGGSTAGLTNVNVLMLGGGLLIAAMMSALLGLRVTRKD